MLSKYFIIFTLKIMNTDPLCGRTIENVMTTDNSVYQSIYLETKNNEAFPEYDSKIK